MCFGYVVIFMLKNLRFIRKALHLLIQTRRSLCVVEIKRKGSISKGVVDEVAQKVARLKRPKDCSVRAALVYDGKLPPTVSADGYFDAIIPFSALLGL